MAITTLENTKWTFKNTLPFASYAGTYNIIFSNDGKSCTSLEVTSDKILYHYNGGTLIAYQDSSWVNENRKTILLTVAYQRRNTCKFNKKIARLVP